MEQAGKHSGRERYQLKTRAVIRVAVVIEKLKPSVVRSRVSGVAILVNPNSSLIASYRGDCDDFRTFRSSRRSADNADYLGRARARALWLAHCAPRGPVFLSYLKRFSCNMDRIADVAVHCRALPHHSTR